jgi:N-acyl-phosphatidylethanolamine-hydrolysing phospholipase D
MDPVFSDRRKRYRPVPISIQRLPKIDAVIISHNHYDHLDYESITKLNEKFGEKGINWFVGSGTAQWFQSIGIEKNVHELSWWQSKKFKDLEFVFTPAQHWCGRSVNDKNKVLNFYLISILFLQSKFRTYFRLFGEVGAFLA